MFYFYFARSESSGEVYVGYTSKSPDLRVEEHNKKGNKFTSWRGPWKLIYYEKYYCKKDAQAREKFTKAGLDVRLKKQL